MSLDVEGISKKLAGMTRRLNLLVAYKSLTFDEYLQNEERQATIERLLEIIIQAAIDINKIILKQVLGIKLSGNSENFTNAEVFNLIGEHGFISPELAEQLAESGRFRNVLAHLYDDIIPEKAYEALQKSLIQYPEYITAIQDYLDSLEVDDDE